MGWGEVGWRADWFGHWINWLGRAAGKEKPADVVEVAIIWKCWANMRKCCGHVGAILAAKVMAQCGRRQELEAKVGRM